MRLLILLTLLLLNTGFSYVSAQSVDIWNIFPSVESVRGIHSLQDGVLWVSTTGGVVTANDDRITQNITPLDGLSRLDGRTSGYSEAAGKLFVGYVDGTIDIIDTQSGDISNVEDIRRNENFTEKAINKMLVNGSDLYIATDFGIVVYDIERDFIIDSFTKLGDLGRGIRVNDLVIHNDTLLAATEDGLAFGPLNESLVLPESWQSTNQISDINDEVLSVGTINDQWLATAGNSNYILRTTGWEVTNAFGTRLINGYYNQNGDFIAYTDNRIYYGEDLSNLEVVVVSAGVESVSDNNDTIYVGTTTSFIGIIDKQTNEVSFIDADGPSQNFFKGLSIDNGTLVAASTNESARNSLVDRGKGYYLKKDGQWSNFNQYTEPVLQQFRYQQSFTTTVTNDYYYIGSWGRGVVRHRKEDDQIVVFDETNSIIRGWVDDDPLFPVISGLDSDTEDNVWLVSRYGNTPLYLQPSGSDEWVAFSKVGVDGRDEYESLFIDSFDQKWIPLETSTGAGTGLLVLNTGDADDESDDTGIKLTTNENNGNLPDNKVNTIIQDRIGEVWIGTQRGIARFLFPDFITISNSPADRRAQWLINEDPDAISRFLLRDVNVSSMAVNAANEKWIGSANQGIWVVNSEGSRIVKRFTSENSQLISNSILSITIDDRSGEVYIATDLGLMSYQDIPQEPVSEMSNLRAYPNPFVYDEHDRIVIDGLSDMTQISVVASDGSVVQVLESRGGRIEWNGRGFNDELLSSGVYFLIAKDLNGGSKGTGKIIIVR